MTDYEKSVMGHVVTDPDAWLSHAVSTFGEKKAQEFLEAKVARWSSDYENSVMRPGYKNRVARDVELEATQKAELDAKIELVRQEELRKQEEFNVAVDARVRAILEEMKIG